MKSKRKAARKAKSATNETPVETHIKGSRSAKQKNRKLIRNLIIGALVLALVGTGVFFWNKQKDSDSFAQLLKEKNVEVTTSKDGKFITFTGKDITDLDMATILDYYHKEKSTVSTAYWVNKKTSKKPDTYSKDLLATSAFVEKNKIEYTANLTIGGIEAKDMSDINYQLKGSESETKDSILNVKATFTGDISDDGVLAESKNISKLIDDMNPDKKYKEKKIRITFNENQYLFDDKHPDNLLKYTYFQVD